MKCVVWKWKIIHNISWNWGLARATFPAHFNAAQADPDRLGGGGGRFWTRGPHPPSFSTLSTDLGHLIRKLLNFGILFYVYFHIYLAVLGGAKQANLCRWGGPWSKMPPWIRQLAQAWAQACVYIYALFVVNLCFCPCRQDITGGQKSLNSVHMLIESCTCSTA